MKNETWVCVDCAQENHGLMLTYDTKLSGQKCSECHRNIVPCMSIMVSKKKR